MQGNDYFPSIVGLRAAFFAQLAHGLPAGNATLMMPALDIASIIRDCRFCEYVRAAGARRCAAVREAGRPRWCCSPTPQHRCRRVMRPLCHRSL